MALEKVALLLVVLLAFAWLAAEDMEVGVMGDRRMPFAYIHNRITGSVKICLWGPVERAKVFCFDEDGRIE